MRRRTWDDVVKAEKSSEVREAIEKERAHLAAALTLADLRKSRDLTQEDLGQRMEMTQTSVSQIERQADLRVSTLRRFTEALGGWLIVSVQFPNGEEVPIRIPHADAPPPAQEHRDWTPLSKFSPPEEETVLFLIVNSDTCERSERLLRFVNGKPLDPTGHRVKIPASSKAWWRFADLEERRSRLQGGIQDALRPEFKQ